MQNHEEFATIDPKMKQFMRWILFAAMGIAMISWNFVGASTPTKDQNGNKFIPPEPWELRRLFEIYKLQKSKRYARLMEIKEKDYEKFYRITRKLLHRQRLKDYRMRLRGLDPKKRELASNRKKIERLANQYYAFSTQFHRQLIERELESTIRRQIEIQKAYENEKIEDLHQKVSKINQQWQSRRHPQQVEYLKRKVLWQASRSVYPK